ISASGGEAKPVDMSDETKDIATGRAPSSSREVDGTDSEELLLIADKQEEQVDAADTVRPDTPESLTIMGGVDKSGHPEKLPRLDVIPGEIVCILGPTGAGKSRLLDDIECLAQGDTPSCRKILINGDPVPEELRSTMSAQLVAQLSQCMNYVIDMTVEDFLHVHADARRRTGSVEREIRDTFECAVGLAGEPFEGSTRLSQLSGGQSRALMVADAAFLSDAPIVLVDEIENAGMDKWKALATLSRRQKIVLVSTHDPAIALMGTKRVIISNGGMHACLTSSGDSRELENLSILNKIDKKLNELRLILRNGGRLEEPLKDWMAELGRLQEGKAPETRTHLS
ncbi:MAG: ATP-binding cassette domain-containing protein, partial [Coriobacteriia bacterium]|nr:ATP-binding cassette domain-containing protein [Coriobacteriia bacterium]